MFHQHITAADIAYRQEQVRTDYIKSQRLVSIQELRQIIGNTFIQMGSSIHGKAREACRDAADSRQRIRETQTTVRAAQTGMSAHSYL